ncbi:hypothetical protein GW17_00002597 [Ensete ventricosum]|nr:hypothetical protein GW17_00002597 [Ensete ventricosum]RZR79670.1 hypothetical protein BHM03_00005461 [Ensete ventricosum]
MEVGSISSAPRSVEEIYKDYSGRRAGIIRALTSDLIRFLTGYVGGREGELVLVRSPQRLVGGEPPGGGGAAGAAGAGPRDQFREGWNGTKGLALAHRRAQRFLALVCCFLSWGAPQPQREVRV